MTPGHSTILAICVAFITNVAGYGQETWPPSLSNISTEKGLSHSSINDLISDEKGFIWIATYNGLNRYDGQTFVKYFHDPADANSLRHDNIRTLASEENGNLWIGTVQGLQVLNTETEVFTNINTSSAPPEISDLKISKGGKIWVATFNKGLHLVEQYEENKFLLEMTQTNQTIGNVVNCVYERPSDPGFIWLGTQNGVFCINEKTLELVNPLDKSKFNTQLLSNSIINDITEDEDNNLWMATNSNGLAKLNPLSSEVIYYQNDPGDTRTINSNLTSRVLVDHNNQLWISMYGNGVSKMDPDEMGNFSSLSHSEIDDNSLASDNIVALYEDQREIIWMASKGRGLSIYNPKEYFINHIKYSMYQSNSISGDNITALFCSSENEVWVGTRGKGLNKMTLKEGSTVPSKIEIFDKEYGFSTITSINKLDQFLLVGQLGDDNKVLDLESGKIKNFLSRPGDLKSLRSNAILCAQPWGNRYFIGTYRGLYIYDTETKALLRCDHYYHNITALADKEITGLSFRKESLWVTTRNHGLYQYTFETENLESYRADDPSGKGLSSDGLLCIFQDHQHKLWIGSWGGGMMKYDLIKDTIEVYNTKSGMVSDDVYSIHEDRDKNIWMSTNNGVSRLDVENNTFKHFTTKDGLQGEEFNSRVGHYESKNNRLYLGGLNGFNIIKPEAVTEEIESPNPFASTVTIISNEKDQSVEHSFSGIQDRQSITLTHRDHTLQIRLSSLHFSHRYPLTYAYKLWPVNQDWIEMGETNEVTLIDLRPGTYRLLAKIKSGTASWSEEQILLDIRKKAPWWKSKLAILLYGLMLITAVFSLYKYRINQLLKFQNLRTKISTDLHDDVGSLLSGLAMQSEVVAEQMKGEQKKRIEEIGYMGRSAIDKMRDIVWSLDTSKDKYANLLDRMHIHLENTIPNTRFSYKFNHIDIEKSKVLSPLLRQNLYLIFKEAVHNAIKHSDGDQLTVSLEKKRSGIVLIIHDNGVFKGDQGTEGMGMRSMEKRAEKISAKFEVDTIYGTSIIITI